MLNMLAPIRVVKDARVGACVALVGCQCRWVVSIREMSGLGQGVPVQ